MKYEIQGGTLPVVIVSLEPGESVITQSGGMSWMSDNFNMDTESGGLKKAFSRMFTGESLFLNRYTAERVPGIIAFSGSFPGAILPYEIQPGRSLIFQKQAFLASESTVDLSMHFNKTLSSGFFGGEGFIMQKASGRGTVFLEIDGSLVTYDLAPGQTMLLDNGYLAYMEDTVTYDVEKIKGMKNIFLGGEGLFLAKVTGPGKIGIQTHPIPKVAQALIPFIPTSGK